MPDVSENLERLAVYSIRSLSARDYASRGELLRFKRADPAASRIPKEEPVAFRTSRCPVKSKSGTSGFTTLRGHVREGSKLADEDLEDDDEEQWRRRCCFRDFNGRAAKAISKILDEQKPSAGRGRDGADALTFESLPT